MQALLLYQDIFKQKFSVQSKTILEFRLYYSLADIAGWKELGELGRTIF
jgi:hypothetical protein